MTRGLNSNHLKMIAIFAMTIDHLADLLYPGFPADPAAVLLHSVGRLTAPIMWFFIGEGYHYTRSIRKYILRLLGFAVLSHFAYCFAFGICPVPFRTGILNQTSVMYPLCIAVLVLWLQDSEIPIQPWQKQILVFLLVWSAFPADWSCIAVLAAAAMYRNRGDLKRQMLWMMLWVSLYAVVSFFFVSKVYGILQLFVVLVYPLLRQYNGERGKAAWTKWLFYFYYPGHLVVVGILRITLYGNVPLLGG